MMDVTVKTLDGQNRSFCVPENITVREFKEKIAGSISIDADTQRLIFQGRVLQDEKLLKDYDVHGKVIHVVQKPPPSTRPQGESSTSTSTTSRGGLPSGPREGNNYVIGSFTIPSDIVDPNQVQQIVQNAVQNMGEMGRNARVSTRASNDGSSVDVHIHLGQVGGGPGRVESESQLRINNARRMLRMAREQLSRLENAGQASGESGVTREQRTENAAEESREDAQEDMEVTEPEIQSTETAEQPTNTDNPMPGTSSQSATGSAQSSTEGQGSSSSQTNTTDSTGSQLRGQGQAHPPGLIRPPITSVADILQEVLEVNRRLQPFLERYQTLTRNDPQLEGEELTRAQQLSSTVGEILHTISHCYHSLSDLMIDFSEQPPRHLYAAFITQQAPTTAVIQQTIPVRAQINIGPSVQRSSGTQSTVPTNTAGTQANPPVTNSTGTQSNVPTATAATSTTTQEQQSTQPNVVPMTTSASFAGMVDPNTPAMPPVSMIDSGTTPMFIEMGPEIVSVSSVTAQIVAEPENPTTSSSDTGTTTTSQQIFPGNTGPITNDLIQSIVNSVLQAHVTGRGGGGGGGLRMGAPNAVQIEIGPTRIQRNRSSRFPAAPGANGTNVQTGNVTPAGGSNVPTTQNPSTSASSTQTNTADSTNTSGTQTTTENTSETQTQTPGRPRTTAFVMPGFPNGGLPGMPGIPGMPGMPRFQNMPHSNTLDPYLPCSSRHFFRPMSGIPRTRAGQPGQMEGEQNMADVLNNLTRQLLRDNSRPELNTLNFDTPASSSQPPASSSATGSTSAQVTTTSSTPINTAGQASSTSSGTRPTTTSTSTDPFVQMLQQASAQMPGVVGIQIQGVHDGQIFSSMFGMPPMRPGHPPMPPRPMRPQQPPAAGQPPRPPGDQNYATMLMDFLQSASAHQRTTSSTSSTTSSSTTSTSTQQAPMSDEAFTRLVSGIGSMVSQTAMGQAPAQPISDFLSTLGEGYSPGDEGLFVNDLFHCLSRHLSMPDLLQIFYGNPTALNRLRAPLQDFVRGRILNDGEPTPENIEAGVKRLIENMQDELKSAEEATEVKPRIDFGATLSNFFRIQLIATIRMIMQTRGGDSQFGINLYERVRQALSELIILTRHCLVGGMPAVDRLIQNRLNNITRGVNPLIQQWMCSTTTSQLNTFVPTITVTEEQIVHYVVNKEQRQEPAQSQEAPMETSSTISSPGASAVESPKSMEVDSKIENKASPSGAVNVKEPVTVPTVPGAASVEEPAVNGATGGAPSTSSGASETDISWEKEIPEEWVPVINGDIQKQKQQKPQRPFSDAYYQGMPAKRRKLSQPPSSNQTENLAQSIRRAAIAAGVEPISSMENLSKETEENTEILTEYEDNMRNAIINRLQTDTDFVPDRFPKSHEYFKGNNKK